MNPNKQHRENSREREWVHFAYARRPSTCVTPSLHVGKQKLGDAEAARLTIAKNKDLGGNYDFLGIIANCGLISC